MLKGLIVEDLMGKCGFKAREILLFGFGQGGMAALNLAGKPGKCPQVDGHADFDQSPCINLQALQQTQNLAALLASVPACRAKHQQLLSTSRRRPSLSAVVRASRSSYRPLKISSSTSSNSWRSSATDDLVTTCPKTGMK